MRHRPSVILLLALFIALATPAAARQPRKVAITIDDLPVVSLSSDLAGHRSITRGILDALQRHEVPAIGFVNEVKLENDGTVDADRVALLEMWLDAGMDLGNHTYSHPDLHGVSLAEFQEDVLRGERVTRRLLADRGGEPRWFRHPYLHTGTDLGTKRALEAFLAGRGYLVAPVTFDNYEFVFARAYERALRRGDGSTAGRVADAYVAYMDSTFGYYEAQSRSLLGAEPAQVLLLHANRLNGDHLGRILETLERRGYEFVALEHALRDPAYDRPDEYTGAGGITWLHRWALTAGFRGSAFAGEPPVPGWIEDLAAGR